jgi:6-phosphogluconolactonase/glucosamine-6-phosphate isomerase/deaminase
VAKITYLRSSDKEEIARFIASNIQQKLDAGKKVLWLISGGSSIEIAVAVRYSLTRNLQTLTVSLTDERYGSDGHVDSNWEQLTRAGFNFDGIMRIPVLTGLDLAATTQTFNVFLKQALEDNDYTVGLFGMGPDGHTAGILPGSSAVDSEDFCTSYQGPDFVRITTTPRFITLLDEAFLYTSGEAKHRQIELLGQEVPLAEQPAQALKLVPMLTVINDYRGEPL